MWSFLVARRRLAPAAVAVLLLAGGAGCGKDDHSAQATASATASLTVPVPAVTQFAVLATRSVNIGARSTVVGGDVGVAQTTGAPGSITGAIDSVIGVGEVLLAQTVTLQDRARTGEIGANTINVGVNVITGPRSAYVAPPPGPAPAAVMAGTTAVTVNVGATQTLGAGNFGAVTVNGTLNLSGGLYQFQSLRLGPDGRLTAVGASTVRVSTGVAAADRARLLPGGTQGAGALRLIVNGTIDTMNNSVTLGNDVQIRALVVARNTVRAADRLVGSGAVSAQDFIIGNDSDWVFNTGFGCGSNASCNDNNSCTNDVCTDAQCVRTNVGNGTACSDGNACTQTDTCNNGNCVGANPVVCMASDQCHVAGVCAPATGICSNPNAPNGTACTDGNACTQTDTCQTGTCTGANPVVCMASDQCHVAGVCAPATGICSNPNAPNGTPCMDGNACTQTDACAAGACMGSNPVVCMAQDQCHVAGVCDPANGTCSNPNAPNGTPCMDGNACTQTDACAAGACMGSNPVVCTAQDQCHVPGVCDPANGTCSNPDAPNGTPCVDGNACTQTDACAAGACMGSNPVVCTAQDQCHVAGVCIPASGTCTNPNAPNGTPCNDNDICTHTDACQTGACTGPSIVTRYPSGLAQPDAILSGSDGNLWFISPETSAGGYDGSLASVDPADGSVSAFPAGRKLVDLASDPDGTLWTADRSAPMSGINLASIRQATTAGAFTTDLPFFLADTLTLDGNGNIWFASTDVLDAESDAPFFIRLATRISDEGEIQQIVEVANAPRHLTMGPDGNAWLTESSGGTQASALVAKITSTGAVTEYPLSPASIPNVITAGPDGNLWFADAGTNTINRITTAGVVTSFPIPTAGSGAYGIAVGPDGNLWFTQRAASKLGRITPSGTITELACLPPGAGPSSITSGPDGKVWLTESATGNVSSVQMP